MKTKLQLMIALIVTAIITMTSIYDVAANTYRQSEVIGLKKINKIKVSGNVELFITQSLTDGIKVYENQNSKGAVVSLENGVLSVSSTEKIYVSVQVSDLQSITASDNAVVKTYDTISSLSLSVLVKDNASAVLDVESLDVIATTSGMAKLTLIGSSDTFRQELFDASTISVANFKAADSVVVKSAAKLATF